MFTGIFIKGIKSIILLSLQVSALASCIKNCKTISSSKDLKKHQVNRNIQIWLEFIQKLYTLFKNM